MLKTANSVMIVVALVLGGFRATAAEGQQPDPREEEFHQQQEQREIELERFRLEQRMAELEAAERRLHELRELKEEPAVDIARLEDELHNLRVEESELRAMGDRMALEQRHDEVRDVQRQLVELHHAIEVRELELTHEQERRARAMERRDLAMMTDRLAYVDNWHEIAFDCGRAVMMAAQAIVEIHMAANDPGRATDILENLLERIEDRGARTAIRFALRDVYMETEQAERASQHMVEIILENVGGKR